MSLNSECCLWYDGKRVANVAGAAIRNFRIGPSLSNRIESGRLIRIQIESQSFTGRYSTCPPIPDASSSTCPCLCALLAGLLQFTAGWSCRHKMLQLALCPELAVTVTSHQYLHVYTGCLFIDRLSSRRRYWYKSRCSSSVAAGLVHVFSHYARSPESVFIYCRHVVSVTSLDNRNRQNSLAVSGPCDLQVSASSSVDVGHFGSL